MVLPLALSFRSLASLASPADRLRLGAAPAMSVAAAGGK
jgi:hypothetical protein